MNGSAATCPECGADQRLATCAERLGFLLAWEVDDEALRALHFLTVASYNLQHPAAFTDEAIAGLQDAFRGYLDGRLGLADIRRRASRAKRVLRADGPAVPRRHSWPVTIDTVAPPDSPAGAAARVEAWARAIYSAVSA